MAPAAVVVAQPASHLRLDSDGAALRRRNEELERELQESRLREERMKEELRKAWNRVKVAEDAEEMLCAQLGDLEAEAVDQARDFQSRIVALMEQLSQAQRLLQS